MKVAEMVRRLSKLLNSQYEWWPLRDQPESSAVSPECDSTIGNHNSNVFFVYDYNNIRQFELNATTRKGRLARVEKTVRILEQH